MTTTKEKKFGGLFFTITKLLFFLLFLIIINNITAYTDESKLFVMVHDEQCKDTRNLVDALLGNKFFSKDDAVKFESKFSALLKGAREQRLEMSAAREEFNIGCSLSEMAWEDRRDHIISGLNFMVHEKLERGRCKEQKSQGNNSTSTSHKFLKHVAMDVIDDDLLLSGEVFSLTGKLPCLASPPERPQEIQFRTVHSTE